MMHFFEVIGVSVASTIFAVVEAAGTILITSLFAIILIALFGPILGLILTFLFIIYIRR